jgi:hypothetical protein
MTHLFPLEATIGDGRLVLVERLAGSPEQGIYLAASVPPALPSLPAPPYYLVSTALEPEGFDVFRRRALEALLLFVPGVAPLHGIVPFDVPHLAATTHGSRQVPLPSLIGMIEACPSGVRSHEWTLPMPALLAARCALQVAFSLAIAHSYGMGVGGIRPEHIFINGSADAPDMSGIAPRAERFWQMLPRTDFGIAPAYHDTYDAPEQLARDYNGKPTPAADVFSLCATLAFWLSGNHPFAGKTLATQMAAMREGRQASAAAGAAELMRTPWMRRGLDSDPEVRPSIGTLSDVLQRFAPDVRPAWEGYVS